jgi:predicted enzyme related to lactoylglutathione lyase
MKEHDMARKKKIRTQSRGATGSATRPSARKKKKTSREIAKKVLARKRAKPQAARTRREKQGVAAPPPKPGSFIWHELMTRDTARAKDFYSKLFGWKMQDDEMMPGFIYTMISNKGDMLGGMMAITPEQGDTPPHWMIYISVRDVDAAAQQCESMGGEIIVPAHDIPVGRWALLQDPTGAKFAIYKSRSRK